MSASAAHPGQRSGEGSWIHRPGNREMWTYTCMYVSMVPEIAAPRWTTLRRPNASGPEAAQRREETRRNAIGYGNGLRLDGCVLLRKRYCMADDVGSCSDRYRCPREFKEQSRRICSPPVLLRSGFAIDNTQHPAARLSYESASPWYAVDACRNRHYGVQTVDVTKSYRFGLVARQDFDVVSDGWL
jgi:hypothetical protein